MNIKKQKWIFVFAILIVSKNLLAYPLKPDLSQTPGTLCTISNNDFKEFRYHEQIPYCNRNVDQETKVEIYREYGIPAHCKNNYTIDHFMPLSIGGDNEQTNLWPEHKKIKETRPMLEWNVYVALRDGDINQEEATNIIFEAKLNPDIRRRSRELLEECLASRP